MGTGVAGRGRLAEPGQEATATRQAPCWAPKPLTTDTAGLRVAQGLQGLGQGESAGEAPEPSHGSQCRGPGTDMNILGSFLLLWPVGPAVGGDRPILYALA